MRTGPEMRPAEIEEFVPGGWPFAFQELELIVAVEMVLVGFGRPALPLEQLVGDVGIAGRRHERGEPVERGIDAVLDGARLDLARPADDARCAEAAFHHRAFGALERGHAAVGPGEHLGAIVGGENDDGVVRSRQSRPGASRERRRCHRAAPPRLPRGHNWSCSFIIASILGRQGTSRRACASCCARRRTACRPSWPCP